MEFVNNKNYSYVSVKLKFMKNPNCDDRGPLTGTLSPLCCWNDITLTSLRSGFQNRFILGPFCSNVPIISVLLFQIIWIVEFKRPNCRRTSHLYLPFSIFRVALTSPSTPRTFLLFVTVVVLSFYPSPVNSTIRNADGNFTHKENCRYYCHSPGVEFM